VIAATLHLLDGPTVATTDTRGRAVVVGGYNAPQAITVTAPGYVATSRVGVDAQFQGVKMAPVTPRPTRTLSARIHGLLAGDALAYVQVGDARTRLSLAGASPNVATDLTVIDAPGPLPVSIVVYDGAGAPARRAITYAAPDATGVDVTVLDATFAASTSSVRATMPAGFPDATTADLRAEAYLRSDDGRWLSLGGGPLVDATTSRFEWTAPDVEPVRETKIEVSAHDDAGRVIREIARGTTLYPAVFRDDVAIRTPTRLVSPAAGATNVDAASVVLKWSNSNGARVHRVVVETLDGSWRRVLLVAGSLSQVKVPSPVGAGLASGTSYRWSVESSFGLNIDSRSHDDDDFETKTDGFSASETATFTTK